MDLDIEDFVERRQPAEVPTEHQGHRILVKCLQLKLELEVEPIFASMAIYDAKERKKISENFYFDMNSDELKRMMTSHIPYSDVSTQSRSAIFELTNPSTDLFLVIRLEKVLQGDLRDSVEPYMKEDKDKVGDIWILFLLNFVCFLIWIITFFFFKPHFKYYILFEFIYIELYIYADKIES